jgi:hypothetical protein
MTLRTLAFAGLFAAASQLALAQPPPPAPASGQPPRASTPTPAPAPAAATPAAPAPRRAGQPVNVKIDVTISDQASGTAPALKKTVSVVTGDGMSGFIRSEANYSNIGGVPLNVDTEPEILADGKIRVRVNLQYDLPGGTTAVEPGNVAGRLNKTLIRENLSLVLESGKPLVAAQSADPVGDRQVTIEVKATILR